MSQFVVLNGHNVNLAFVRKYQTNTDGSVRVWVEREPAPASIKGDEAAAFLAAVGAKVNAPASNQPPSAKVNAPASNQPPSAKEKTLPSPATK